MSQTATTHGHGNVVVQIVGDGNAVTVAGAIELVLTSYEQASHASAPLRAEKAGERASPQAAAAWSGCCRRTTASLPFQGREELQATLRAWLAAPGGVSVQALIGGGGRGKTRLAAELAAWARAQGWTAGFARREALGVFRSAGCRTTWGTPCLVVVDYAAAQSAALDAWLRSLAHVEAGEASPLRLLILERTGGEGAAWWRGLFNQPGTEGEALGEMLGRGAPLTVNALSDPAERHAVFAAAYAQATDTPLPQRSAWLDQALVEASLGGEPLFLAMFGLVAAQQGLAAAPALEAKLVQQELERIGKHWSASGLATAGGRPLHAHLAAVASLSEGWTEVEAHGAIVRESAALYQAIPEGQTGAARAALHDALPGDGGGVAAIVPDILGEAAAIDAFGALPDGGVAAVQRAAQADRARANSISAAGGCQASPFDGPERSFCMSSV